MASCKTEPACAYLFQDTLIRYLRAQRLVEAGVIAGEDCFLLRVACHLGLTHPMFSSRAFENDHVTVLVAVVSS